MSGPRALSNARSRNISELVGAPSSGKTTWALGLIAQAQARGVQTAFVDAERTLTRQHAADNGVDLHKLVVNVPDTAEDAFEVIQLLQQAGTGLIVLDALPALYPRGQLPPDKATRKVERLLGIFLRRFQQSACCHLVIINHLRLPSRPYRSPAIPYSSTLAHFARRLTLAQPPEPFHAS